LEELLSNLILFQIWLIVLISIKIIPEVFCDWTNIKLTWKCFPINLKLLNSEFDFHKCWILYLFFHILFYWNLNINEFWKIFIIWIFFCLFFSFSGFDQLFQNLTNLFRTISRVIYIWNFISFINLCDVLSKEFY
jgi:hypothetical protein